MNPLSALAIAAATTQFVESSTKIFEALFGYWQSVKEAPKRSKELQQEMFLISNVLIDLRSALASHPKGLRVPKIAAPLGRTATEFAKTMDALTSRIQVKEQDIFKRLKWPFDEKENEIFIQKLERFKGTFTLALEVLQG